MKYIAYYRVSTAMQGQSGLGLEAQRKAVLNYGGCDPIAEFTEVESGKRDDRPQLKIALASAKAQAFDAQGNLFNQTVDGLTPQTLSRQELGDALKTQAQVAKDASAARGDELYGRVGTLAGDAPATGSNVEAFLTKLESQRAGLGQSAALNKGPAFEQALAQARAIHGDISGGNATFNTLKDARTSIGALANDPSTDKVLAGHANDLYAALTADMSDTAAGAGDDALVAWKKANNRFRRTMTPDSVFNPKTAIDPIIKAKTPEQAADWVLAQANKGGTRLQAVRRQVENSDGGRDVWNQVTGSVVERT